MVVGIVLSGGQNVRLMVINCIHPLLGNSPCFLFTLFVSLVVNGVVVRAPVRV